MDLHIEKGKIILSHVTFFYQQLFQKDCRMHALHVGTVQNISIYA